MLILTRHADESIVIQPEEGIDPSMTLAELFRDGPLEFRVLSIHGGQVRIGVDAPQELNIIRDELLA